MKRISLAQDPQWVWIIERPSLTGALHIIVALGTPSFLTLHNGLTGIMQVISIVNTRQPKKQYICACIVALRLIEPYVTSAPYFNNNCIIFGSDLRDANLYAVRFSSFCICTFAPRSSSKRTMSR